MPLRHRVPPALAAFVTFVASGLFHEYEFVISFPSYRLGRISVFFALHGVICAADAVLSKLVGPRLAVVPWQLKAFAIPVLYSPTVPLFSSVWIEHGFFTAISQMGWMVSLK